MYKIIFLVTLILSGCGTTVKENSKPNIVATIPPVQYLVDRIADTTVNSYSILEETTSPETFDITPDGMKYISNSDIIFSIGLIDFEHSIEGKLTSLAPKSLYIKLADVTDPIEGICSHGDHSHAHGVDPHVWLSLANMESMAELVASVLIDKLPENKELYLKNRDNLIAEILVLDSTASSQLKLGLPFAIVHPSLTYFARDYDLEQIAIELDGKEPSAAALKELIDELREKDCTTIFYSRQNPITVANHIASEVGAQTIEYDPVQYQWLEGMELIVKTISSSESK